MPRIAGVDVPNDKRIWIGLTSIYGIGRWRSQQVLKEAGVDPMKRGGELTEEEIARIRDIIEKNYVVEGDLRQEIRQNIRRLMEIGSYRGLRHRQGLPVRGQRTRSNARTRKGPRGAAIAKKKKV